MNKRSTTEILAHLVQGEGAFCGGGDSEDQYFRAEDQLVFGAKLNEQNRILFKTAYEEMEWCPVCKREADRRMAALRPTSNSENVGNPGGPLPATRKPVAHILAPDLPYCGGGEADSVFFDAICDPGTTDVDPDIVEFRAGGRVLTPAEFESALKDPRLQWCEACRGEATRMLALANEIEAAKSEPTFFCAPTNAKGFVIDEWSDNPTLESAKAKIDRMRGGLAGSSRCEGGLISKRKDGDSVYSYDGGETWARTEGGAVVAAQENDHVASIAMEAAHKATRAADAGANYKTMRYVTFGECEMTTPRLDSPEQARAEIQKLVKSHTKVKYLSGRGYALRMHALWQAISDVFRGLPDDPMSETYREWMRVSNEAFDAQFIVGHNPLVG